MLNSRQTTLWSIIKPWAMLTIGVAIVVFIANETINAIKAMRGGATATARVISADEQEREYDDGRRVAIVTVAVYEFAVNGRQYYGKTEASRGSLSEGDILTILYYPEDPSKNRVKGSREVLGNLFTVILFGGVFSYFLIKRAIEEFKSLKVQKGPQDPKRQLSDG